MISRNTQIEVSFVVATYNSNWEKLRRTLLSILYQKDIQCEIIVADDGSVENHFDRVKVLFGEFFFTEYQLLSSIKNEGTCKNFYKAVVAAKGLYVRALSPGDYIASDKVISRWLLWSITNQIPISFGNTIFFNDDNGSFKAFDIPSIPHNAWVYSRKWKNKSVARTSYLLMGDTVCAVSVMVYRELLLKYLSEIIGKVIYAEDSCFRLMVFDGVELKRYNKTVTFYEYGTGISTGNQQIWVERICQDVNKANDVIKDRLSTDRFSRRYKEYLKKYSAKKYAKLVKFLLFPWCAVLKVTQACKPARSANCGKEEYEYYQKLINNSIGRN